MGLGRREYLQFLGAAAISLILNPGSAVSINNSLYINRKLGVAFYAPERWHFADVKEMGEVIEGQINATENELAKEILRDEPLPILTISRDVLGSKKQFTPGITIYLNRCAYEKSEFDLEREVKYDNWQTKKICEEFEMLSDFVQRDLSGCNAIEYTASFLFKHELTTPTKVRMRSMYIDHHPACYAIRMFDSPYINGDFVFSYDDFLENFKLV